MFRVMGNRGLGLSGFRRRSKCRAEGVLEKSITSELLSTAPTVCACASRDVAFIAIQKMYEIQCLTTYVQKGALFQTAAARAQCKPCQQRHPLKLTDTCRSNAEPIEQMTLWGSCKP